VMEATQTFMGFQENMLKCFLVWRKCCQWNLKPNCGIIGSIIYVIVQSTATEI
jgi:hypothetical protein